MPLSVTSDIPLHGPDNVMVPARKIVGCMLIAVLVTFFNLPVAAQDKWKFSGQWNLGCHLNLTYGKGQRFPGLKIYSSFSAIGTFKEHLLVNYGPSISIYTKTIGANLNPLVGDIQIDFTNSFSFGYGWGKDILYRKQFRTIHTGDFYNVSIDKRNAILLTTNFILNNHRRHQVVGAFSLTLSKVTFNYANDGAFPFTIIPLADNFDRYWTGSAGLFFHNAKGYNTTELSFDQFTGYTPLLYELSNLIGINIPLYDDTDSTKRGRPSPSTFNTASYQVKFFTDKNFSVDAGIVGSLMDKKGVHYGIQDLIHMKLKMSLHPNNDVNRYFIGGSYNNLQHVKL